MDVVSFSKNFLFTSIMASSWLVACASTNSQPVVPPSSSSGVYSVEVTHESCDIASADAIKTDVNHDGRADLVRVMKNGREWCRVVDLNFDGKVDTFWYFDERTKVRRRETDFDRDGRIDEIALYRGGQLVEKQRETNLDGKLDTWDTYQGGRVVKRVRDSNGDGKVDQWWTFPDPAREDCPIIDIDETSKGVPSTTFEPCKELEDKNADNTSTTPPAAPSTPPAAPSTPPAATPAPKVSGQGAQRVLSGGVAS